MRWFPKLGTTVRGRTYLQNLEVDSFKVNPTVVAVSDSVGLVLRADTARFSAKIVNTGDTVVYIDADDAVAPSAELGLDPGDYLTDDSGQALYAVMDEGEAGELSVQAL